MGILAAQQDATDELQWVVRVLKGAISAAEETGHKLQRDLLGTRNDLIAAGDKETCLKKQLAAALGEVETLLAEYRQHDTDTTRHM